jgi:hypothetical protein
MTEATLEKAKSTAIILANAGELLGPDSPYDQGRRALKKEYGSVLTNAKEFKEITSHEDAEKAAQFGRLLQVASQETESYFKRVKVQIDNIKKPVLEAEKQDIGAYAEEKMRISRLQVAWDQQVRREREESDRIAREAAERQAREDRLNEAVALESMGEAEQAEAVLDEPIYTPPVVTQVASAPRIQGKVAKVSYSAKVTNLMDLVRAVAAGKAPIQSLVANESFINAQARAFKDGFSLPGCELQREESVHYRG